MRGLAAAAVVLFHMHFFFPAVPAAASAYLAVDLFFALSGFVLAHAYAARLDAGISAAAFMGKRFARLWPLYLVGLAIAAAPILPKLAQDPAPLVFGLFMLPWPAADGRLYPLNIAAWSLLYELLANGVMVLFWTRLNRTALLAVVAVAALGLAVCARTYGTLNLGFTVQGAPGALARVMFSFFLGVLIWRARPAASRLSPWIPVLGLALVLACDPGQRLRPAFDLIVATTVLPAILWLGASAEPGPRSLPLLRFAGAASYAVYVTHIPILKLAAQAIDSAPQLTRAAVTPGLGLLGLAALLGLAWLLNLGDVRLRRRLEGLIAPARRPSLV